MGFTQQFGFIEHGWCVFRQTFTGNGSATTFQLTSNVGNAVFASGAWDIKYVQTTYASDVTKTTRAALYDSALPLTRHKISISSISATGLVTLDYPPQSENFFVWYWYDLAGTQVLDEYYRDDFVNAMEADSGVTIASGITLDTTAFGVILSATQDTVQKAIDVLDDHGHPQSAITGLTTASSPVFATVKLSGLTDNFLPYHINDSTGLADSLLSQPTSSSLSTLADLLAIVGTGSSVSIVLGQSTVRGGHILMYGYPSPSPVGGYFELYTADDYNTIYQYYHVAAYEDYFVIDYNGLTDVMKLTGAGVMTIVGPYVSTIATGTAPFTVTSTTLVSNLNADQVDSLHAQTLTATSPITLSGTTSILAAAGITIAHATTAGNVHIPTGGATGQILIYGGSSGTVAWTTTTWPNTTTAFRLLVSTATSVVGELAAVGATGEYLAGATGAIPAWATLNQAAVAGLTTGSSPTFVTVKLSGLTDGYVPYHAADATGLADTTMKISGYDFLWMTTDTYPAFSIHVGGHDLSGIAFDANWDGAKWVSGYAGSNFVFYKTLDELTYYYAAGIAAGSEIATWTPVFGFTNAGIMKIYGDTSDTPTRGWISFGGSYDTTAFAAADNNVACNKFRLYDGQGVWMCGMGVSTSTYNLMTGTYFKFLCDYTGTGTGTVTMLMRSGMVAVGTVGALPVATLEVQGTAAVIFGCTATTTNSYSYMYFGETFGTTPVYLVRWNSAYATRPQDFDIVNTLADVNIQGTAIQVARFTGAAGMSTVAVGITGSKPGTLMLYGNGYVNFGTVEGTTGYGIRNNSGYVQVKHSDYEDTWEDIERTHEISKAVVLVEDFYGNTGDDWDAFQLGWHCGYSGTGAQVTLVGSADGVHLGTVGLLTGTTTTGYAGIDLQYLADSPIPGGDLKVEFIVKSPGSLSDVTDTYKVLVGLSNVADGTAPADGIYFTYAYTESGGSWECITCHDGAETTTDSAIDVATNTWYRLGFVTSADGLTVKFYIDGTLVATHTTNIPGASDGCGPVVSIIKSAGTNDRVMGVDAFYLRKRVSR